jgi:formylglycine-generating enzyme required for sulfatase activity
MRRADEYQVDVTLSRGFWIGQYEVTQEQWRRIAGALPRPMDKGSGADVPVYWVNYSDAERFCERLTERAWAAGDLDKDWEFRLPTEAQWEYACRAGSSTATSFGDRLSRSQANFDGEPYNGGDGGPEMRQSVKAGTYPANAWGIHDMHGNVFEWCRDWYHAQLPGGTDPDLSKVQGAMNRDGTYSRVRRGGAWNDPGWACRSAFRLRYEPERTSDHIGFRVVAVQK